MLEKFLPEELDTFIGALDELAAERGDDPKLVLRRIELLEKVEDTDGVRALLDAAGEEFPDDEDLLARRMRQARSDGVHLLAVRLLEKQVEQDEEERPKLFSRWSALQHSVNALAVKEKLMEEDDGEEDDAGHGIPGMPAGMILPAGAVIVTASGTFTAGGSGSGKQAAEDRPSIDKVKEAVDEEDFAAARTQLRRLWRKFQKGEANGRGGSVIYFFGGNQAQQTLAWPEDEEEEEEKAEEDEEEEKKVHRGGLDSWSDEEPEPPKEKRNAYEVLAQYDFGVDEMQRLLRSKTARELDNERAVFLGLLEARVLRDGPEVTLEALMEAVTSGRADKVDTTMLLTLLDEQPELQSGGTDAVLGDLIQAVRPTDIGPLRSLARVHARQGNREAARRLYTWCATRTSGTGFNYFGSAQTVSARELVKEVKEQLEGEDRLAVIDAILGFADPGDYPWARENFDNLILETYMELLEPAEAFERCRSILEEATDFKDGLRRRTALLSVALWAQNGDFARALECFEYGVCSLPEDVVEGDEAYWNSPTRPGYWGAVDIKRLFPKDPARFSDPAGWYLEAAEGLQGWMAEDRVRESSALQALVIISLRLKDLDQAERGLEIVRRLEPLEGLTAPLRLWIADAAREHGDEALADRIERAQFAAGNLHLQRIPEVVRRELEEAGPAAALEMGEAVVDFTLHEDLLETLVEAAEATGDAAVLDRWTTLRDEATAARARLEEIREEAKRKAEEKEAAEGQ